MQRMIGGGRESKGRGREGGCASGRQKHSLNDWTWVEEPSHTWPHDPSAPSVYCLSAVTSPRSRPAPGCLPGFSFFLHHLLSPSCRYDQRQALREMSLSTDITLCLSHTCLKCLLLIPSDASHQPANEQLWQGERETETDRKGKWEGAKEGGIRKSCLFCKADRKRSKMLSWTMLSNIDCDFLGEKQPALVNLEWLWNNLDHPSHIVEWQTRNALQQFIALLQSHIQTIWNDRWVSTFLWIRMSSLLLFLSISVSLDQFSTTLHVCRLVLYWSELTLCYQIVRQRLIIKHLMNKYRG